MSDPVVQVRGLRKAYGSVVAVDNMDLEVPRGALFGLLGPNGAGKSTTFGICCGWLRPSAGSASLLGVECNRLHELRGRLAALPQDAWFPRHVPVHVQLTHFGRLTGLDRKRAKGETERVLHQVGLAEAAGRKGIELSHGMLKRVGLAQALIGEPEVVFLDEPTSGLDPASARKIKDVIAELVPAATVVISSHNLAEIQEICTHGAILDHGKLVTKGTIDDLTRRGAEIAVELRPGAALPLPALHQAFGGECVAVEPELLRITFDSQRDVVDVIATTMRILLDEGVPVLGIHRGTSLETAFLEITGDGE